MGEPFAVKYLIVTVEGVEDKSASTLSVVNLSSPLKSDIVKQIFVYPDITLE